MQVASYVEISQAIHGPLRNVTKHCVGAMGPSACVWERIFYALTGSAGVFAGGSRFPHSNARRPAASAKGRHVIMPLHIARWVERPKTTG